MDALIIGLIAVVAIAVVYERWKSKEAEISKSSGSDEDFVSADEAGPTQSGIYRLQELKQSLQKTSKYKHKKRKKADASTHQSIAHQKIEENESSELPDPFSVELKDDI